MKSCNYTRDLMIKELKSIQSSYSMMPDWQTLFIVVICIAVDTLFLYGVTDNLFYQSAAMSFFVALMIAFGIDGLPVVIANKILKKKKNWLDNTILISCTLAFFSLIVGIFALRWSMMDLIYTSGESLSIASSMEAAMEESTYVASNSEKFMTVIMSIIPLSTSLITFAAATQKSIKQKKFEELQSIMIYNEARKQYLLTKIHEVDRELSRELDVLEQEKYENMLKLLHARQDILDGQAKTALAMKMNTPEAVRELLGKEEGF